MDQNTFVAGVTPGGFQDVYEVRILICYLLHSVSAPLSKEQLHYIFQENNLVNYFTFSSALSDLAESGQIVPETKEEKEYYSLCPLGAETAKTLQHSLPRSVRDKVVTTAIELLANIKKERENEVTIEAYQNGYNVKFIIHDTDFDLLKFRLFVPDKIQAELVRTKFMKDPVRFYQQVIRYLTTE